MFYRIGTIKSKLICEKFKGFVLILGFHHLIHRQLLHRTQNSVKHYPTGALFDWHEGLASALVISSAGSRGYEGILQLGW